MKSYEEVTSLLLERRDRYEAQRRQNRKREVGLAAVLCCFCLVAGAGILMHRDGIFDPAVPIATVEDAVNTGITDHTDVKQGELPTTYAANNKIVIHSIDGTSSGIMNIALMRDDFVEMTREEMIAYYGVDYYPEVPADIPLLENHISGIFKRNGGTGEIYWDEDRLSYANDDFTRRIGLSVNKGNRVFQQFLYFQGTEEKSIVNNMEVLIGLSEDGYYYAEFMLGDVGFLVSAYGVTEAEFVAVIASVLK